MFSKNRQLLLGLVSILSLHSFAGSMGEQCLENSVVTPCEQKSWLIAGRALYLIPNTQIYGSPYILSSQRQSISYGVKPDWGWGFQFEGAYLFGQGNDININWSHYRQLTDERNKLPSMINYSYPNGVDVDILNDYQYYSASPQWDQVNIEVGQLTKYSEHRTIRFHGGGQFSRVANQTYSYAIESVDVTGRSTINNNDNTWAYSTFNGFGPRIGLDLSYVWDNGIGMYAKGAGFVLGGSTKSSYVGENDLIRKDSNLSRAVAGLDGKLGVNYHYAFRYGYLDADIGWLWNTYINALGYMDNYSSKTGSFSNFEIQGLYFGLKWQA
jgi:hypothetical protein